MATQHYWTLDFETRSLVPIKIGAWRYADDPSAQAVCLGIRHPDGRKTLWVPDHLYPQTDIFARVSVVYALPDDLADALSDPNHWFIAHNAEFELAIWRQVMQKKHGWPALPMHRLIDTMAMAAAAGLPMSLTGAASHAGLGAECQKSLDGAEAMKAYCIPKKGVFNDDPKIYNKLLAYCAQDVEAEWALFCALPRLTPTEQAMYTAHLRINMRGFMVDDELARAALAQFSNLEAEIDEELRRITNDNLCASDLRRRDYIVAQLNAMGSDEVEDMKRETVAAGILSTKSALVKAVLQARQEMSRSSTSKFQTMLDARNGDERLRGAFVFHGCSTARFASHRFQAHNLPKTHQDWAKPEKMDIVVKAIKSCKLSELKVATADSNGDPRPADGLVSAIRSAVVAPAGKLLYAVDFSSIEARVAFWMCGDGAGMRTFEMFDGGFGPKLYNVMAGRISGVDPWKVDKNGVDYKMGKQACLALQYGMGCKKFVATCAKEGIELTEDKGWEIIRTYRDLFKGVKNGWDLLEAAAKNSLRSPNMALEVCRTTWVYDDKQDVLLCVLPSGRTIHYRNPSVVDDPNGRGKKLQYFRSRKGQWFPTSTWGGTLLENVVQACSRDLLVEAILRAEAAGWPVVLHVHDELVAEGPDGPCTKELLKSLEEIARQMPAWAEGLPMDVEGWCGPRYRK